MIKNIHTTLFEQGKIKIGGKGKEKISSGGNKYREAIKFDYFVITTLERDNTKEENFQIDAAAMEGLPEHPTAIPVELLYDDIDLNFPTCYAMFGQDGIFCRGDGEVAMQEGKEIVCNPDTCKYYQKKSCKISGILLCRLPHLNNLMGVYKFRTHSWNSVKNILASLQYIQTLTGGIVAGLPFELRLERKPTKHGIVKIVNLVFPGGNDALIEAVLEEKERRDRLNFDIQRVEAAAISAGIAQDTDSPDDVKAEFFPEGEEEGEEQTQEEIDAEIEGLWKNIRVLWEKFSISDFERNASIKKHLLVDELEECRDRDRLREYGRNHQEQYKAQATSAERKAEEKARLVWIDNMLGKQAAAQYKQAQKEGNVAMTQEIIDLAKDEEHDRLVKEAEAA